MEDLKEKIERLEKEMVEVKEQMNKKSSKRWKPKECEKYYYYYNEYTGIDWDLFNSCKKVDLRRYNNRNMFKTEEEAQAYLDNMNTYYELMDLADELNEDEKIDWEKDEQIKYYLVYDYILNSCFLGHDACYKNLGQIYCLDKNFLDKAKEQIGKERLIKLFKGE